MSIKKYDVWIEGYSAPEDSSSLSRKAAFEGSIEATSFNEACIAILGDRLDKDDGNPDGYLHSLGGYLSVWGCRCFDNEQDARESFG